MELRDYLLALRRYWRTWLAVVLAGLAAALAVVLTTPPSYQATAQVFVASLGEGTSGSQFVNQRVTSYPEVARSSAVLEPVRAELQLPGSVADLRARVSASNPADTSQIDVTVTDSDAARAAEVANAVAERFVTVVEQLERPGSGESPVELTVTDPATAPSSPVAPAPGLLLPLGVLVGLGLGVAAAVVRSRLDTRLHTADDVHAAWSATGERLTVHAAPAQRSRRHPLAGRPVTLLARQLEPLAEGGPLRVVALSPSADDAAAARRLIDQLRSELAGWEVPVDVTGPASDVPDPRGRPGVQLSEGTPLASLREWRRIGRDHDGVVLVVEAGRVDRTELQEVRSILTAAGIHPLAVVMPQHRRTRRSRPVRRTAGAAVARLRPVLPRPAPSSRTAAPVPAGRR